MASSKIRIDSKIQSIPETGFAADSPVGTYTANYVSIGALKIQFGTITCSANTYHDITFKEPFNDVGYVAIATYTQTFQNSGTTTGARLSAQTTTGCKIYSAGGKYCWLCIGY